MTTFTDTPFKRFTAFWLVLGLFVLFGIVALVFGTFSQQDETSPADRANASRRLAVKETVVEEQARNFEEKEVENGMQVPPEDAFASVAKKLLAKKPVAVREERHRDPALAAAPQEGESQAEEETEESEEQGGKAAGSENAAGESDSSSQQETTEKSDSPQ